MSFSSHTDTRLCKKLGVLQLNCITFLTVEMWLLTISLGHKYKKEFGGFKPVFYCYLFSTYFTFTCHL